MPRSQIQSLFDEVLAGRRLLEHPFYRRWENGELAPGELAAYASQYRHFEAALPSLLEALAAQVEDVQARAQVEANLDDERSVPAPHLELFDRFVDALGADQGGEPSSAMTRLLGVYRRLVDQGPVAGLAGLCAYEMQAPQIAASKAEGLRRHYSLDAHGTAFWDVHAAMDSRHGDWALDALARVAQSIDEVRSAASDAARAWWEFLDEREALAPARLAC